MVITANPPVHFESLSSSTVYYYMLLMISLICQRDLYSQRLKVFNLNTSQFPDITANFALYNEIGIFIYDKLKKVLQVNEDSHEREMVEFL